MDPGKKEKEAGDNGKQVKDLKGNKRTLKAEKLVVGFGRNHETERRRTDTREGNNSHIVFERGKTGGQPGLIF